ncbi:hypothetical protein [Jannaschia pohangensis]|uniref:Uncharacterized protein n=1 Tax=Jannaschia pohangensis TaxID=390807 RepID=A0A1I3SSQ9_9RHOB|nr:hypothetical protein [Jannaschia pohangensis]SFJ61272.1 hypothetical protein SAMN04488095_3253 [Jannaschia pohangensis]
MGTMVAGAPLLAGGPPGWVAYAGLGVITLVGGIYVMSQSRSQTRTVPATGTQTDTSERRCNRPWSVRVHAQGSIIGGRGGATLGAPPIVSPSAPVTSIAGIALAEATYAMLSRSQKSALADAKVRLQTWVGNRPPGGFLGQQSFRDRPGSRGSNRFDVDSYGCTPNFIT